MTLDVVARLSHGWYGDRLSADFVPKAVEGLQSVLSGAGLTGEFWRLAQAEDGPARDI